MGKKDKAKKIKVSSKNASKKDSPQTIRNVNFRGSDPSTYTAVTGEPSDTDDAITAVPSSPVGSNMPAPSTKSSKPRKEKKGKKEKKDKKEKKRGKKKEPVEDVTTDDEAAPELTRKPSPVVAPLPALTIDEYKFFEKVKSGDTEAVAAFIESQTFQNMSINRTDIRGYTVLHYAVQRQDEDMVRLLLQQPGIRLYDTILHAIKEENVEITKLLLELYDRASSEEQKQRFMTALGSKEDQSLALSALVSTTSGVIISPQVSPISARSGIKASIKMSTRAGIDGVRSGKPSRTSSGAGSGSGSASGTASGSATVSGSGTGSKSQTKVQVPITSVQPQEGEDEDMDEMPFDPEFPPMITPLMLAAQEGCLDLIDLFYLRDERLESAEYHHNLGCACDICLKLDGDQDMSRAYQRYHLLKALSHPVYICYMARKEKIDPVNYAISKILKVREIIEKETAFNDLFAEFEKKLELFISELITMCRDTKETEIFLSPKDTEEKERLPHLYPRLWYAMGLKLKGFVAVPNFQNIVYKMWATDGWPDWDTYGNAYRFFNLAIRIVAFPLIALLLLFGQDTRIGRPLATPLSRFLTHVGSYIFFLLLVSFQALWPYQRCNDVEPYYQIDDDHCKQRGPPRIGTEWLIVMFVLGFYVNMLKRNSVSWYWNMRWNWYDLITQVFFTLTFMCWLWSYLWTKMPENQALLMATDRLMWPHDCAEIYGECLLSLSLLLASGRILRFFAVHPHLGPIQVALGKQIVDFMSSSLIMVVVIVAFTSGTLGLYLPYKDVHGLEPDELKGLTEDSSLHTVTGAFKMFFFTLYGSGGNNYKKLLTWKIKNGTGSVQEIHHTYTEYTGKFLELAYGMIGSTLIFSMLAGYFSKTVTKVMVNVDAEWKYARTELYLMFIKDSVLPPPFNILPTFHGLQLGIKWLSRLGSKHEPKSACSMKQCCFLTSNDKTNKWQKLVGGYRKLMLQLIFRYLSKQEEVKGKEKATKDDVVEIGEELAEIIALIKKAKEEKKNPDEGNDDDDDDFPPGGGGTGTVASVASGLRGWSKPKYIVESAGSTYLKNTGRGGGSGGTGGASSSTTEGGNPMSAQSAPVVTTQPSSRSIQSGITSAPSSSPPGTTAQVNVLFTPTAGNPTPKRPSGLLDFTGSGERDFKGDGTPVSLPNNNNSPLSRRDFTEPSRGSRSGGGLEGAIGMEDFSGSGTVESAFISSPKTSNFLDMEPTPKKDPGLVDPTGMSPPVATSRRKSPPQTNLFMNMEPTPKRSSGVVDFTGVSPQDPPRRNSKPGLGTRPPATGLSSPVTGMANSSASPTSTNWQLNNVAPTPRRNSGVIDVWSVQDPNSNRSTGPPPPTRKMSPGTKMTLAEPEPSPNTFKNVAQMKLHELTESSIWDSPDGEVAALKYQTSPPHFASGNELYSPSNSPSMNPTTTSKPSKPSSIPFIYSSAESVNATDGSSKANYESPSSDSSRADPRAVFSQQSTSPLAGGFKLKDSPSPQRY